MSDWLPGAQRRPVEGGAMEGQPWRSVVFHTSESGYDPAAIDGVAGWVVSQRSEYHLLWNPWHGQFLQLIPASQSARALRNAPGGYRTNRKGTRLIQVCIVGSTSQRPLAGGSPLKGWDRLRDWLDSHGIPHTDLTGSRDRGKWESSGVHRHADAPGNDHTDPGPIDFDLLYDGTPAAPPAPRRNPAMILVSRKSDGRTYLLGLAGPAYITSPDDLKEIRRALKDPNHTAEVGDGTFDRLAKYAAGGALP